MTRDVSYPIAAVLTAGFAVGVVWHGVSSTRLWHSAGTAAPLAAVEPVPPELFAEPIATPLRELVVTEPLSMPLSVFPALEAPVIHAPLAEPEEAQPEVAPTIEPPAPQVTPPPQVIEVESAIAEPQIESARPALPPVDAERYTSATTELSKKLLPEVQAAFAAGKQGSLFVSQQRFMAVLQKIATAKDAAAGSRDHAQALRSAIVALEEAEEFTRADDAASTEIDPANIAASHVTPVVRDADAAGLLPHTAIAHYHQYAVANFMRAAGGEQAASMALFGLGRVNARRSTELSEQVAQVWLKSQTYYEAALAVHPQNHLAANELAVLLAQAGRYGHASSVLRQAVQQPVPSYVHHNLAVVEAKLGNAEIAAGADAYAAELLAHEKLTGAYSRNQGVQWVNPQQFASTSEGLPSAAPNKSPTPTTAAQPPQPSGWRQAMGMPKKLMGY